jgi:hypothetical protein
MTLIQMQVLVHVGPWVIHMEVQGLGADADAGAGVVMDVDAGAEAVKYTVYMQMQ